MITPVDERLRREASAFVLRFACEDCAHAAEDAGPEVGLSCSLGYPTAPRRESLDRAEIVFCKEFELGDP